MFIELRQSVLGAARCRDAWCYVGVCHRV